MPVPNVSPDRPPMSVSLLRGLRNRCPSCGGSPLYKKYLKLSDECPHCHSELGEIRADDLPAYLTIVLVGHIIVPLALAVEKLYAPSVTMHMAMWIPMILVMTLGLLPGVKGATVGLMWQLGLKGDERQ